MTTLQWGLPAIGNPHNLCNNNWGTSATTTPPGLSPWPSGRQACEGHTRGRRPLAGVCPATADEPRLGQWQCR